MKILGIDYGRAKVGIAVGDTETNLAEPLRVIRYGDTEVLRENVEGIIKGEEIEKIVLGLSEGEIGEESKVFGEVLKKDLNIPVEYVDETLTSHDAERLSIEAGIKRARRKGLEDAFSAALILQNYLDSNSS